MKKLYVYTVLVNTVYTTVNGSDNLLIGRLVKLAVYSPEEGFQSESASRGKSPTCLLQAVQLATVSATKSGSD